MKHVYALLVLLGVLAFCIASEKIDLTKDGGIIKEIITSGTGDATPPKGAQVSVHYVGTLTNGEKFDSSRDRGSKFDFNVGTGQVIKGWDIGIMSMKKGEIALFTIKPEYAYGKQDMGPIKPDSTLIFEVELFDWEVEEDDGIDWGESEEGDEEDEEHAKNSSDDDSDWDDDENKKDEL
jgi:FK506-binding protein 4/5